jgi:hypothetical protein
MKFSSMSVHARKRIHLGMGTDVSVVDDNAADPEGILKNKM